MKRTTLLLMSLLSVSFANAQWSNSGYGEFVAKKEFQAKRVISPSPEAAELGKYGNTPVSLFTGTPKINIPLHELKGNRLDLPINLSYNASGFKPEELATWAGLGWSLNAGGVITRAVLGSPDVSWNYFNSSNDYATPPATNDLFANYDYMDNIRKNYNEGQPDVYYYNFAGHSGKFLLKPDQSVVNKEKNNLVITHCITCTPSSSSFTVTDENGNTYYFAAVEVSTTQTDDGTSDATQVHTYTYPSSWYLSSIVSADSKEEITFTYYDGGTHTLYNNYVQNGSITYSESTQYESYPAWAVSSTTTSTPPTVSVTRKYLQKISFLTNGVTTAYVDFVSAADQRQDLTHATPGFSGERLLQSIKAFSRNTSETYTLTKQYNLSYSYFTNTVSTQYYYKRLRLDSIQQIPTDGSTATIPAYTFEYSQAMVPALTNASVDHWGFYNGGDEVSTLVPTVTVDGNNFGQGADREPTLAGSSCASLVKIKYPTGGYTTFEYELNAAKDPVDNSVRPVGGIRVKQIIDYSFENKKATVKNYSYASDDGTTSGKTVFPIYYKSSSYHAYHYYVGVYLQPAYNIYYMTVSASSVFGLGSIQGSHVGYSKVTESRIDLSTNATLGKTVYNYNIAGFNSYDDNVANGDLKVQSAYDNGGKLLDEQTNTYTYTTLSGISAYTVQASTAQDNQSTLCRYTSGGITYDVWKQGWESSPSCSSSRIYMTKLSYNGYTTSKQYKQLTETSEKKYDQLSNSYISTVQKFTYGNTAHTLPTMIEQSTNNDEVIITEKKYPLDYTIPSGTLDAATQGIQLLQSKNIIGAEIESVQRRQTTAGTNQRYINGLLTIYDPATAYPVNLYRLETAIPIPLASFSLSSTTGTFSYNSNYKPLAAFSYYTTSGNLSQQAKNNDISTAYVWDNDNTTVTAEVVNADASLVAYSSFETSGLGNWSISDLSYRISGGITGSHSYNLVSGATITKTGLSSSRLYIVSYWSKSGAITVSSSAGSASATTGISLSKNGWTYYQHLLPSGATSVTLTGSSSNIDELRLYPADAQMQTYTYNLDHGLLVAQSSAQSGLTFYEYDNYNRLVNVKDDDGNIVKNFTYNYGLGSVPTASAQTLYYSAEQTGTTYTKQTSCSGGTYLPSIVYKVSYGKYVSSVSQAIADNLAIQDRDNNGQAAANALPCLYGNVLYRPWQQKNNCTATQGPGNFIRYVVAAGTFKAETQALADQMAHDDATANGQAYANANAGCSCGAQDQRYINGTCETGTRYNSSAVQLSSGQWQCTYYYQFSDNSVSPYYYEYSSSPCPVY